MFILLHVFINSEDLAIYTSSSTRMDATVLYSFFNVVTRNLRMSRGGLLITDGNPKGYELAEHTSKKFEVNPQMFSTLKTKNPSEA